MAEGSFPKDLYFGGDYDSEGQSGPSAEKIPRLLLMGMRRFVVVSFDSFYLSYITWISLSFNEFYDSLYRYGYGDAP